MMMITLRNLLQDVVYNGWMVTPEVEVPTATSASRLFMDKDGNTWSDRTPTERRRGAANIVRLRGGPRTESRQDNYPNLAAIFSPPKSY